MDQTPEAFATALSSGETDRVNRAIDAIKEMDLEERAGIFEECFELCRDLYEGDNGYQRQSVVRFADALYPRLAFRMIGAELRDEELPDDRTLDELAAHRDRLRALYLDALVDDDGRVRRAAAKALKQLALTADLIEADDELQTILTEIELLAEEHDSDAKQKHLEQAYQNVAFHAEKPESLLPAGLQDILK